MKNHEMKMKTRKMTIFTGEIKTVTEKIKFVTGGNKKFSSAFFSYRHT
jgi:hypothetical protein